MTMNSIHYPLLVFLLLTNSLFAQQEEKLLNGGIAENWVKTWGEKWWERYHPNVDAQYPGGRSGANLACTGYADNDNDFHLIIDTGSGTCSDISVTRMRHSVLYLIHFISYTYSYIIKNPMQITDSICM